MKTYVPAIVVGAVCLAVGVGIGRSVGTKQSAHHETTSFGGGAVTPSSVSENSGRGEARDATDDAEAEDKKAKAKFDALLRLVKSAPGSRRRGFAIQSAIYELTAEQMPEAWEAIRKIAEDDPDAWAYAGTFFEHWATLDEKAAMAAADALEGWRRGRAYRSIVGVVAEKDPPAAMAIARGLEKPDERNYAIDNILLTVAAKDRPRAFSMLLKAIEDKDLDGSGWSGVGFMQRWAKDDPRAAAAKGLEIPGPMGRRAMQEILQTWGKETPEEAVRWLDERGDTALRNRMIGGLLQGWASEDPKAAADYAVRFADDTGDGWGPIGGVLRQWAGKDLDAARAWVDAIEDPLKQEDARLALIRAFTWEQPEKGAELVLAHKDNPRLLREVERMAWRWAQNDPREGFQWAVESLPGGDQQSQFLRQIVGHWAANEPKEAAAHLHQIPDERQRADAHSDVASAMARNDLEGAMAWVGGLEPGPMKDKAVAGIAGQYASKDPLKASEWLQSFGNGPTRDLAVAAFSSRISSKDPHGAWDWAATISDPNRRNAALEHVARTMLDLNREESEAFVRDSELLSEETKWRLLDQ